MTLAAGRRHLEPAFAELEQSAGDVSATLQRFGEKCVAFICEPETLAAQRMVIAEAGRSDIGQRFYQAGPKIGHETMAKYLSAKMDEGILRRADKRVGSDHLMALLQAEIVPRCLLGLQTTVTRAQIRQAVKRQSRCSWPPTQFEHTRRRKQTIDRDPRQGEQQQRPNRPPLERICVRFVAAGMRATFFSCASPNEKAAVRKVRHSRPVPERRVAEHSLGRINHPSCPIGDVRARHCRHSRQEFPRLHRLRRAYLTVRSISVF